MAFRPIKSTENVEYWVITAGDFPANVTISLLLITDKSY